MQVVDSRQGARRERLGRLLIALVATGLLAALTAAPAGAQARFRLDSLANTTVAPGVTLSYHLLMTNIGNVAADGTGGDPIILSGTLPTGITAQAMTIFGGFDVAAIGWSCSGDGPGGSLQGATNFSCSVPDAIPAHGNTLPVNGFGIFAMPELVAAVDGGASGTLTTVLHLSGGGAIATDAADPTIVTTATPSFGIDALDGQVSADADGSPLTQAGGRPYSASVSIDFNTTRNPMPLVGDLWPVESVKDVFTELPPGFVGNPTGVDTCTAGELANGFSTEAQPLCPATSQVGTSLLRFNGGTGLVSPQGPIPLYNMVPPPGIPARFGMNILGSVVTLDAEVRSGGDYGITVAARDVPQSLALAGTTVTLWGVPSDPSHDAERACPGFGSPSGGAPTCPNTAPARAFLRNPTSCTAAGVGLQTNVRIDSWAHPDAYVEASFRSHANPGYPYPPLLRGAEIGIDGCDRVPFTPSLVGKPLSPRAGSPSAFTFDLSIPQTDDPNVISQSDLKTAVVTLPPGVHVSPSSAQGLGACAPAEIHLHDASAPSCPQSAKVGTATITTPLLPDPLEGSIYLAKPHDNPFGSLLSIYLVAKGSGVVVKLAGRVDADPVSGQLTTTFDNNPQLPFSNLHLEFKGGPRAPLAMPTQCGKTYTTHAVLTGWSGRSVASESSFAVSGDGKGAACDPPHFTPDFHAGTANPVAGRTSTFSLALSRDDQDEQLGALTVHMPEGLTGKIANATLCSESDAAHGACGDASKVGDVTVGAGAGTNPFYITQGRAYVTGPYKGAPFGLSIVVPAVAGPFNLGNVNVRSALFVDKHTSELSVVSDPLPTILEGIPLDVRDVRVSVNKSDFIVNPTSCARKAVGGVIESTAGARARVSSPFQVGECARLGFQPRMVLRVGGRGHTTRNRTTPLSTTIRMPKRHANLRFVRVTLPDTINARLTVINDACTRAQFETDIVKCAHARAGTAVAVTPLLRDPLRGDVYFVGNGHPLPDLFVALRGQVDFDLIGRITIPHSRFLRTTFATAPDVPVRSFTLNLFGGPRTGSLGAATNLCSRRGRSARAQLDYVGQNGKAVHRQQRLVVRGCAKKAHHRGGGR
ncbi:MAG TPA: hypothetical protein VKB03_00070 [Conexibacter sp.]|nr:hypothetical protein [Conexibacter sp.]